MEVRDAIARRKMTRRFDPAPLRPGIVTVVLETATRAPSAGFTQGVELLTLESPSARNSFWALASSKDWRDREPSLLDAPLIVVPVADPSAYVARYGEADKRRSSLAGVGAKDWPVPYWLVDAAFASMLILLAATDAGLGALFFRMHADETEVLAGLGIPANRCLIGAIALGVSADADASTSPRRRRRRTPEELIHRERW